MQFLKLISGCFAIISCAALIYGFTIASIPIMFCATVCYLLSLSCYLESQAIIEESKIKKTQDQDLKQKVKEKKIKDLQDKEQRGEIPTIEELSLGPDILKDGESYSSELVIYKYLGSTFHVLIILNMQENNSSLILTSSKKFEELQKRLMLFTANPCKVK